MICLDSKCPYCRDGHHCAFVETDDLPCMMDIPEEDGCLDASDVPLGSPEYD